MSTGIGTLALVTAPEEEPISAALMKAHLRVLGSDEDIMVDQVRKAARDLAESETERRLITQTWKLYLDAFPGPGRAIVIPYPPLQSVTSITYVDDAGATQTWGASNYVVDTRREPGRVRLAYGQSWPSVRYQPEAVQITFVCGYGATGDSVPAELMQAMLITASDRFEHRESFVVGTVVGQLPERLRKMFWRFRVLEADV